MEEERKQEKGGGVAAPPVPETPPAPQPAPKKNKKRSHKTRNIIIAVVVIAAVVIGLIFLIRFLTKQDAAGSTLQSQPVSYGSIQSKVSGSGNARSKDTAAITLTAGGVVSEVLVSEGEMVYAGQPLYTIDSQAARDEVTAAQEALDRVQQELNALYEGMADLTVTAPFAGKIMEVGEFPVGSDVPAGSKVCTLVNDRVLKMSLYFSYAYENSIYAGQSVQVSIPATMSFHQGRVEKINKVEFISPEGGTFFEVVITLDNPGTLTEGMDATAFLTGSDGTEIYPYENGKLAYYEKREIIAKAGGPVLSANLLNYAKVSAGQMLLSLGDTDISAQILAKEEEVMAAQQKLEAAQTGLDNFNAVAPIDGTVTSCAIMPGQEVKSGDTVITIANTATMIVEITVDDRNIAFVKSGMTVELSDWNGNVYMGTVTNINMDGATGGQGMTSYPVTLSVDNYSGSLLAGMWLDYSFVTSQSDNCMMVPMQSVKNVSDADGSIYSVVFIQADQKPENAVELEIPPLEPGQAPKYPSPSDGFYPVPVETGLNDDYNIEIKSGLNGDETVFVNYLVESASSWE